MNFMEPATERPGEIVAECNPEAYSTALGFVVKTGTRSATRLTKSPACSHFLEHGLQGHAHTAFRPTT